ncbi:MAG: hypothetical protein SVY10_18345 [Thermodesulfobacteriota bacterium]|nr:hypothetical protein [Thermodesulfobacteriota bacterium]
MEKSKTKGIKRVARETAMKEIDRLYEKLFVDDDSSRSSYNIDSKMREKLYKRILDDLDELREKQRNLKSDSSDYKELDRQIRMRLLKEIQIIMDEYMMAKKNDDLKKWEAMYGDIDTYRRNFFYYRMDKKYEAKKKVLKDYRFA